MKFTEDKLEKAFAELLGQEGFPHQSGIAIKRNPDEVLIKDFQHGSFSDKILNIKYIEASSFILKSDNWPSALLVIQAILTIIFFVSVFR